MNVAPPIRYARAGHGVDIAYWRRGTGPAFVEVPHVAMSHLRLEWPIDAVRRWYDGIARTRTVIRYDHRGSGLSGGSHTRHDFAIEALAQDIDIVADALNLERFALCGRITGGLPALAYAAAHPERVTHLVLWNTFARDTEHGQSPRLRSLFKMAATDWELFTESISQAALGWEGGEVARQWAVVLRGATTQSTFLAYLEARRSWDISPLLARVRVPTLVLFDEQNALVSEARNREIAAAIPDARLAAVRGDGGMPGHDAIAAVRSFLGDSSVAPATPPGGALTAREREVLALVATGVTNAEIAQRLSISVHTVTRHLTHIYTKTGAVNRVQAIRFANEQRSSR